MELDSVGKTERRPEIGSAEVYDRSCSFVKPANQKSLARSLRWQRFGLWIVGVQSSRFPSDDCWEQ